MLENQSVETIFGVPPVQDLLSNGLPVELQSLGLMTIEQLRRRDRELYQRHEDQLGGKWAALLCLYGRILLFTTDGLIAYPKFATKTGKLVGVKLRDLSSSRQWQVPSGLSGSSHYPLSFRTQGQSTGGDTFICEGETDALSWGTALTDEGIGANVIGCPGATNFRKEWVDDILRETGSGTIYVIPDPDIAGERLSQSVCQWIPTAKQILLPPGKDLSATLSGESLRARELIDSATPIECDVRRGIRSGKVPARALAVRQVSSDRSTQFNVVVAIGNAVTLKGHGSELRGLCPFHDEKTPSFFVNTKKNVWYCQGCNQGGDAIEFLMRYKNLNFFEARDIIQNM